MFAQTCIALQLKASFSVSSVSRHVVPGCETVTCLGREQSLLKPNPELTLGQTAALLLAEQSDLRFSVTDELQAAASFAKQHAFLL